MANQPITHAHIGKPSADARPCFECVKPSGFDAQTDRCAQCFRQNKKSPFHTVRTRSEPHTTANNLYGIVSQQRAAAAGMHRCRCCNAGMRRPNHHRRCCCHHTRRCFNSCPPVSGPQCATVCILLPLLVLAAGPNTGSRGKHASLPCTGPSTATAAATAIATVAVAVESLPGCRHQGSRSLAAGWPGLSVSPSAPPSLRGAAQVAARVAVALLGLKAHPGQVLWGLSLGTPVPAHPAPFPGAPLARCAGPAATAARPLLPGAQEQQAPSTVSTHQH